MSSERPAADHVNVSFYGCEYRVRLTPIRERLIPLAAEAGLGGAASRLGISRMTLHRLLNPRDGRRIGASTLFAILSKLGLKFGDISEPVDGRRQAA